MSLMNEKTVKTIHKAYSIVLSVSIILLAFLFIINAIGLFSKGGEIASFEGSITGADIREMIGRRLMNLLAPIIITVLLVFAGPVLDIVIPKEADTERVERCPERLLAIMKRKHKDSLYTKECADAIHKERKFRLYFTLGGIALFLVSILYPLIFVFTTNLFTAVGNANSVVSTIMVVVFIFLIPTVIYSLVIGIFFNKSRLREYELIKKGIKRENAEGGEFISLRPYSIMSIFPASLLNLPRIIKLSLLCCVVILAIIFIILGIINGGMADVLNKAVNICRECIGLG